MSTNVAGEGTDAASSDCRLLVLLGAGASYDCASRTLPDLHDGFRPPLVTQLFANRPEFTRILHQYPLAEQAAADIRPALSEGSVALEAFLRGELRDSEHAYRRRQDWAVPLYLQDLLFNVCAWDEQSGRGYVAQPDNYDRLVNATLRIPEVTFVTLNYDNLLDRRLFVHGGLTTIDSYLAPGANWALIKPHGSIDWGRRVLNPIDQTALADPVLAQTLANLGDAITLSDDIVLRPEPTMHAARLEANELGGVVIGNGITLYYPALSAPLGAEDELVCPENHVSYLRGVTGCPDPLDVLVIGYSGLDQGVLELLGWGGRNMRSLAVVSDNGDNTKQTAAKVTERVGVTESVLGQKPALFGEGCSNFVSKGLLAGYVADILSARPGS